MKKYSLVCILTLMFSFSVFSQEPTGDEPPAAPPTAGDDMGAPAEATPETEVVKPAEPAHRGKKTMKGHAKHKMKKRMHKRKK